MSSIYECSQCERQYTSAEYDDLDRQQMDPDEENPRRGRGYERVCECGAGFYSDQWSIRTDIEVDSREITVTTYGLNLAHGPDGAYFYETAVFDPKTDHIADRHETKDDAKAGHERIADLIREERFHFEPVSWRMVLEDDS